MQNTKKGKQAKEKRVILIHPLEIPRGKGLFRPWAGSRPGYAPSWPGLSEASVVSGLPFPDGEAVSPGPQGIFLQADFE